MVQKEVEENQETSVEESAVAEVEDLDEELFDGLASTTE